MTKLIFKKLLIIAFLFLSFEIFAQVPPDFTKLFQAEQYQEAIDSLKSVDNKMLVQGKKDFLIGLCYSRLRKYDEAIQYFKNAVNEDDSSVDLHYEYGQALYANNNLKQARYEFSKSAGKKINYTASIYYVAYISELIDDVVMAKASYRKLIKDGKTDKKFLQISLFQYTKILLKMMRREEESLKTVERNLIRLDINLVNYIPRYIFPLLRKTIDIDLTSQVGIESEQLMRDLVEEFKLDPNILLNGRRISPDRLYANVAQRLKYDDNIALTKKSSTIYETEVFGKYDFVVKKKVIITPELRLTYTKHKAQETPEVYRNDSISISSAIRNKFEHTVNGQPASFLLDMEYASVYKDWKINHQQIFFSKSYTVGIGEQLSLASSGETYFKLRRSDYTDETGFANYKTLSLSADQYVFLNEGQHLLIATFDMSQLRYYDNETLSNNTYLVRIVYLVFEFVPTYTFQMIVSATITDTKELKELKGYELILNPGIEISKAFTNKIRLAVNYNFTENSSKQAESRYQKQIVGTELSYTF
ncbi:MAG: tetratricopeptide repeat protein [Bacteriovorax sp.]|nr:tetratricopeptide repeat protein [Bacteriovorax sp.]